LTLSAVVTLSNTAEGSRLKCMIGTQAPTIAESMTRLRSSVRNGLLLLRARA
jgi:hypothetical protein